MNRLDAAIEKYSEIAKYYTIYIDKPKFRRNRRIGTYERVQGYKKRSKKVIKHGIPKTTIQKIASWDPSKNYKYLDWILSTKLKLKLSYSTIEQFVILFHKAPQKFTYKNIYQYKTKRDILFDLHNASLSFSKSEHKKMGSYVVEETDDYKIIIPHTIEASKLYGSGTKWCTTNEKSFDFYNSSGTLYYCIVKNPRIIKFQEIKRNHMKIAIFIRGRGYFSKLISQLFLSDDSSLMNPEIIKDAYNNVDFFSKCLSHYYLFVLKRKS
jgi:hypothetical protein